MKKCSHTPQKTGWLAFTVLFCLSLGIGAAISISYPAVAAPVLSPPAQAPAYASSPACANCHKDIFENWTSTRHAQAFSSPIFQRDWSQLSKQTSCLECHTTGFNADSGGYAEQGVTCESCHGPFQPTHPEKSMPIKPDANLCSTCHKPTTDEWRASPHSNAGVQCQSCHNPHSQTPMADSITALCTNCHKERGDSFTHSTHSSAGLECSNCHMYTAPRTDDPIGGLASTGHTFSVGSEACIGCHQDTVHTRNELVKLGAVAAPAPEITVDELQQQLVSKNEQITSLEISSQSRLYTGLIQGAIVGLATGGAAAWIVSKRIRVIEEDEDE